MDPILQQHDALLDKLNEQQIRLDALLQSIAKLTAQNDADIRTLREATNTNTNAIDALKARFAIVQWLGISIATLVIGYLFQHFIK